MKQAFLEILRCPECSSQLSLQDFSKDNEEIENGMLVCRNPEHTYPVINHIPRFVPKENYSANFGFQWNLFKKTQLDSHSGLPISRDRFLNYSGWSPEELKGKLVLDMGCGAGRFAEIALSYGARVVAVDYSNAVESCRQNLAHCPHLEVTQADIYHLPFEHRVFDYVYCFGVLQHTPCPKKAFMILPDQLKPKGKLAVDIYPKLLGNIFWPKYWLRPLTRRIPNKYLFPAVQRMVRMLLPISLYIGRIPLIGQKLKYAIPVANYDKVYPLSKQQLEEWSVLDTFDMLSPAYDRPQNPKTLRSWFKEACMNDAVVFKSGFLVGRGVK